ncbi:hypothetical protein M4D55_08625 [Metabacillus idriensis]|uniref:hypothetical protein n=1 Tax=Metabacillus idriensis TaxID=324768 RepID=UPI0008A9597B|nr:hypothetical protein [Metabacillus idriensis]MCM3595842.1 hypothetical protein [Metabacillus idriensis]OHR64658.1 hypothetical protein HMPREF3291_14865 [Bacillus sp. HMSC76G11]
MKCENELLTRILQKEAAALELLYDHYEVLLLRVIYSAGSDSIFAEKVLIELFRDIWHNPLKYCQGRFSSAAIVSACKDQVKVHSSLCRKSVRQTTAHLSNKLADKL